MGLRRILAVLLIAAGVLGLAYGKVSYTTRRRDLKLGPVELAVKDRKTVVVPVWAGAGAVAAGTLLLLLRGKK